MQELSEIKKENITTSKESSEIGEVTKLRGRHPKSTRRTTSFRAPILKAIKSNPREPN